MQQEERWGDGEGHQHLLSNHFSRDKPMSRAHSVLHPLHPAHEVPTSFLLADEKMWLSEKMKSPAKAQPKKFPVWELKTCKMREGEVSPPKQGDSDRVMEGLQGVRTVSTEPAVAFCLLLLGLVPILTSCVCPWSWGSQTAQRREALSCFGFVF